MFGFSVFLNEDLDVDSIEYIGQLAKAGFKGVFTSIHIPEDETKKYSERLKELGKICQELELDLMVDISDQAIHSLGISDDQIEDILEFGVTGIRADYGIDIEWLAEMSYKLQLAINASIVSASFLDQLEKLDANFSNIQAWHNYYPRPNTGLDEVFFDQQNQLLKSYGISIQAFVMGNQVLRGPVYQGLPSLEKHRGVDPFIASMELLYDFGIDQVFIGDPKIDAFSIKRIASFISDGIISLRAISLLDDDFLTDYQLNRIHHNRPDVARDVIRSQESRLWNKESIEPYHCVERVLGSITMDNLKSGRYQGELQILKKDLVQSDQVNVIGKIVTSDLPLLNYVGSNQAFKLEWGDVIESGRLK